MGIEDDLQDWETRAQRAQAAAAQAYARLLTLAETHDSGQARRVAGFLASTFSGHAFPFDLFELRALDVGIADDAMACIDALRWGRADLHRLVPDGEQRMHRILALSGLGRTQSRVPAIDD